MHSQSILVLTPLPSPFHPNVDNNDAKYYASLLPFFKPTLEWGEGESRQNLILIRDESERHIVATRFVQDGTL